MARFNDYAIGPMPFLSQNVAPLTAPGSSMGVSLPVNENEPLEFQKAEVHHRLELFDAVFTDYFYIFHFDLAAGTQAIIPKNTPVDSWWSLMYFIVHDQETGGVHDAFELEIVNASTGMHFQDTPIRSELILGTPTEPFWFPVQLLFNPNSTWSLEARDVSGHDNEFWIMAGGIRIHK